MACATIKRVDSEEKAKDFVTTFEMYLPWTKGRLVIFKEEDGQYSINID